MSVAAYEDWLDAVEAGEGYYLACPEGHGSLPPRRACPACGATALVERPLPGTGTVASFTVVHVATPALADETPYVTAIADAGPVRFTGLIRDVEPGEVGIGFEVTPGVANLGGERRLTLRPP